MGASYGYGLRFCGSFLNSDPNLAASPGPFRAGRHGDLTHRSGFRRQADEADKKRRMVIARWAYFCQYFQRKEAARIAAMKKQIKEGAKLRKAGAFIDSKTGYAYPKCKWEPGGVSDYELSHRVLAAQKRIYAP